MNNINKLPPFKRFCITLGNLPSSYMESMSYYECILWLCKFLQEQVIPVVNENAEAVNELINWFNNLNVQDEIDHKLDEMVESGELQEIIGDYLNSKAIFGFDNVSSMKSATNLINGSYAETLGYYEKNDGGSALYKIRTITNEDIVDEQFIIALNDNTLIAELIIDNNEVNINQLGAKGNNSFDNSSILENAINKINDLGGGTVFIPNGVYKITSSLSFTNRIRNLKIKGVGKEEATSGTQIYYTGTTYLFTFNEFWQSSFESIEFKNDLNGNCMTFTNSFYKSDIIKCDFIHFKNSIDIKRNAYSRIINCTFSSNYDDINTSHLRYAHEQTGLCEFFYIENCQFTGGDTNSITGIEICGGNNINIDKCDFAQLHNGRAIYLNTEVYPIVDVFINRINLIRTKNIELYANVDSMDNINLNNMTYYFTGYSTEPDYNGIYTHRNSSNITKINFNDISVRQLANATGCNFGDFTGTTGRLSISSNTSTATMNIGRGILFSYRPLVNNTYNKDYTVTATGTNYVMFEIGNNPYEVNTIPPILVEQNTTYTDHIIVRKIIDVSNNKLRCRVFYDGNIPNETELKYKVSILY